MLISLHKNATTTPATRLALQQATGTDRELAQQYGIGIGTVRKWRSRSTVHDASHTAHRLQTTLNAGQEELVIYLRSQLRLPLDDLLAVVREFIEPAMSRSALDRLLRRRGYSRLPVQPKPESEHKPFKAYEPGYVHVDVKYLPQMQDEDKRRYVFVAIDRATRWVFIDIKQHKTAASAKAFLAAVRKAAAFRIHTILTDNGKEFTDRLFGSRTRQPTGEHEFDQLCQALGIEHRLTKPRTPKTNGMVERFNGRLSQVLRSHHFNSAEDLEKTLHRFVWLYNHHLPQKALGHEAPVQALKKWKMKAPDLFVKNVRNHPGPDIYPLFLRVFSMYLIVIAWLYVTVMMAVAEATVPNGSLLGAVITFLLYGLLPCAILIYIFGTPQRKRRLHAQRQKEQQEWEAEQAKNTSNSANNGSSHAARAPENTTVTAVREKA